jgi:uncharacterized spore protein YtfJ
MSVTNTIRKFFQSVLKDVARKEFLETVGQEMRDRIKTRTRLGKGVEAKGATASPLKKLSPGYQERRTRLKEAGELSTKTTPKKSNLTKTGRMIDSVKYQVTSDNKVEIFVSSDQERKVKANADLGRKFLNFSDLDQKRISDLIKQRIREVLRKR